MFSDYLNYYMWAFNVRNRDIAQEMFVDPSLVSKWRTGKRTPNRETAYRIAEVLVQFCRLETDQVKLCSFLNLPYSAKLFREHPEQISRKLHNFLLSSTDLPDPDSQGMTVWDGTTSSGAQVSIQQGSGGYQRYILQMFEAALHRALPFQVFIYTSDDLNGLVEDTLFLEQWQQMLQRSELMQATVKLIYHLSNNGQKGSDYVRLWSRLKRINGVTMYNLAVRNNSSAFYPFLMVIPNIGAFCGMRIGSSQNRYGIYFTDEGGIARLESDFNLLLSKCTPMMERQRLNYRQFSSFFHTGRDTVKCRDAIFYLNHLPIFTLPLVTLQLMLRESGMPDSTITANLKAHRRLQNALRVYLRQGASLEVVLYLEERPDSRPGRGSLPHSTMYFDKTIFYAEDTYAQHLAGTLEFVQKHAGIRWMLAKSPIYPADTLVGYNAFMMDFFMPYMDCVDMSFQQSYGYDMFAYLEEEIHRQGLDRKGNLAISQYLMSQLNGEADRGRPRGAPEKGGGTQ